MPNSDREAARLEELRSLNILDTGEEACYDEITRLASHICGTPITLIGLIDEDRQWFKSRIGLESTETPRELTICNHVIRGAEVLVVPDAAHDGRFRENPLVTGDPHVRFYAGAPLTTPAGHNIGTLCVVDRTPRQMTAEQIEALRVLSRLTVGQMLLRRQSARLAVELEERRRSEERLHEYQDKLEKANARLRSLATTDALTGINNRASFNDRLREEFHRALRSESPLSVMMIDVDHFKAFNDNFGHGAGDAALKRVGSTLQATIRSTDFLARYGGEEFAVILPDTEISGAMVLAERCRRAVAAISGSPRPLTISIGVSTQTDDYADCDSLVKAADEALYRSKNAGRNRAQHTSDSLRSSGTVRAFAAV